MMSTPCRLRRMLLTERRCLFTFCALARHPLSTDARGMLSMSRPTTPRLALIANSTWWGAITVIICLGCRGAAGGWQSLAMFVIKFRRIKLWSLCDGRNTCRFRESIESPHQRNHQGNTVFHDFHVQNIEILQKRPDAVKSCNNDIDDNDKTYREALMTSVGCIPSYWKTFVDENVVHLPDCHTKSQFKQLANMLPAMYENTNLQNGTKLYDQPCTETKVSTTIFKRNIRTLDYRLWLAFYYDADEFKEILNSQAFTVNDLWSQIGGFVGIFLGFSCLQVKLISLIFTDFTGVFILSYY